MEYDTSNYYTYKEFVDYLKKKERSLNVVDNIENMKLLNKHDKRIPLNPKYYYRELNNKN
jgi:hypothetical protein